MKLKHLLMSVLLISMILLTEAKIDREMLSAKNRHSASGVKKATKVPAFVPIELPSSIFGRDDKTTYSTCKEAWSDMIFWMFLLYGDWYGNHGSNTVMYDFWKYGWSKGPEWFKLCFVMTK
jgi:hypothetical protein